MSVVYFSRQARADAKRKATNTYVSDKFKKLDDGTKERYEQIHANMADQWLSVLSRRTLSTLVPPEDIYLPLVPSAGQY